VGEASAKQESTPGVSRAGIASLVLVALVVVAVPVAVSIFVGQGARGALVSLAGICAAMATAGINARAGLVVALVVGAGGALVVLASSLWIVAALAMAAVGFGFGLTAQRGWQAALAWIPSTLGFVVADAGGSGGDITLTALEVGVAFTVWGLMTVAIVSVLARRMPLPSAPAVSGSRAVAYAALLAIAAFITTSIAVAVSLGQPGGWLIMTPFIVLQPYVQQGWDRSLRRAGGTVLGFAIAYIVASLISSDAVLYSVGIASYAIAMYALIRRWDYVVYAAFLTIAIVILEGASSSVEMTAEYRLEATAGGVGLALLLMALALPLYRSSARKYQLDEY